ncbi:MAG TPA: TonB-dependent receptor [Bryobacteraceae bacterium]|nr:TonB-dependent receptor [Bryobacteraceae bacterium]
MFSRSVALACVLLAMLFPVLAQNVTSSVTATIVDSSGAAAPGLTCRLLNQATGVTHSAMSAADGSVTFPAILSGAYTFTTEAAGFKAVRIKDIQVTSSERRSLGTVTLQIGELRDTVSVTADVANVQMMSAEHSGVVTGSQLNEIALKGRDFFSLLATIPGIVDTNPSREATSNASNGGTFINGSRDNQKNFSVDGITDMDTGSNQSLAFLPNMDAIAEVKVLTSNYQAEFGRNSGGMVTVITKSGGRELHGSGNYNYRHESLNANSFFNNRTNTPKSPYRYRINGFSIGGPIAIPKLINRDREKFFFFFSQEYTGVKKDYGTRFINVPTALERQGDFSKSYDVSNALIVVKDPATGLPYANNTIPQASLNKVGQAMLNFLPQANYTDSDPRNLYRWNYRTQYSGNTPRRNDIFRVDANLTDTFTLYYRYGHDKDVKDLPWGDWKTGGMNYLLSPVHVVNPGYGHLVRALNTFSPTLVNEFIVGYNAVSRDFDLMDPSLVARSNVGNPAQWYKNSGGPDYIPDMIFAGNPASAPATVIAAALPNHYENKNWNFSDNLTKIWGTHSLKAGIYIEPIQINHVANINARGAFDFSRDTNNPFETNNTFANALTGNFRTYTEASAAPFGQFRASNIEWYVQDNWRVTKRLTLDFGMRLYAMPAMREINHNSATWDPTLFQPSQSPVMYVPGKEAGKRVAMDPRTGATAPAAMIGFYVPGTGDPANGSAVGGINGYPDALVKRPALSFGPRFGFAYDLFGNGKTAIRGGFGMFQDTGQTNPLRNSMALPPIAFSPVLYYGNLDTYAQTAGALSPSNLGVIFGEAKLPYTMNFSFGIQQQIKGTVVEASYVGAQSRHNQITQDMNPIPLYSRFDPANGDPTQPGKPLPDNFLRPYRGYGALNVTKWAGTSNYNSLQVSANRRFSRGLQFGAAFTWSKTLGVGGSDGESISPYFAARQRNYGVLSFDRPLMLVLNFMYEIPKIPAFQSFRPAHWVLDNWSVSGISSFVSGSPFTPGLGTTDGADLTGSGEGARINVIGDPHLDQSQRTFYRNFNTDAFARTPVGSFGNAGLGMLYGPGSNNWDLSISKRIPLFSEGRYFQFRTEMFNAFNHTQFNGLYTGARFDTAGKQTDPNFGAYAGARPPRIIQLSARIVF